MCSCDDNPPKAFGSVWRTARKHHRCSECWRTIGKGERYQEHSGLWDHGWDTYRWCVHCEAGHKIAEAAWNAHRKDERYARFHIEPLCFCFEGLWESVDETFRGKVGHHGNRAISRLIAGARRKWHHKRGPKVGQLMPVPEPTAVEVANA